MRKRLRSSFKIRKTLKHFGLLGRAKLWIPKAREADFQDAKLFVREKTDDKDGFLGFSVLPQSVGIRFIKEKIETEKTQNDWEGIRLVWNAYAWYLFKYAQFAAEKDDATGCEVFADRIAEAAKEQNRARVCVDLSTVDYDREFGDRLIPALSERGIDVLVKELRSRDCLNDFRNKGRSGIRALYKNTHNDIWFLPGADLTLPGNKAVADNKAKALFDKKNALLQAIATATDADIKLSEEDFCRATVKEIFDALEKNPAEGTVTVSWRENHPLQNALIAWARAYCGSKTEDGRKLMHRSVKLIPEKEDDKDFFPQTFEQDAMAGKYGNFGCLCDLENRTITFVKREDWLLRKKAEMLVRIARDGQRNITEYDWEAARFFFSDLVKRKMETGYDGFRFRTDPNIGTLLDAIGSYASQPRSERANDLEIEFGREVEIPERSTGEYLGAHPEYKDRISYKVRNGIVQSVILKSRSHYLLDTVQKTKKLAFAAADIHNDPYSGLGTLLKESIGNGLKELIVPKEALFEIYQKIFLGAAKGMLCKIPEDRSVSVTSEDTGVIEMLLRELGNDGKRTRFCIKSEDGNEKRCLIVSRKAFLEMHRKALLDEIKRNTNGNKVYKVPTSDADEETLRALCTQLNKSNAKGNLRVKDFNKDVAKKIIKEILTSGVNRAWSLEFRNCPNAGVDDLIKCITKGFAVDVTPGTTNTLGVMFYPAAAKKEVSEKILQILKDKFKETNGSYAVLQAYWQLDPVSVLQAADDPNSKVTELVFNVREVGEGALKLLQSGIETFCKEVSVQRNDWKIKIDFNRSKQGFDNFKSALKKDSLNDDRKRILKIEKGNDWEYYRLIVTSVPAKDFFIGEINGDSFNFVPSAWDGLSIKSVLQYANLTECSVKVLYDIKQQPNPDELKEAVASVLKSPTGRTGWVAVFEKSVDMSGLTALNGENGV